MAKGREHTPEERFELVGEARELVRSATAETSAVFEPNGSNADAIVASLAARGDVDAITPAGRMRGLKRSVLKISQVFLRDQGAVNRLTVTALEDLVARMDAIEARLTALETASEGRAGPES